MAKIGFVSLGCEKNRVDTEIMLHKLYTAGHEITPEDTEADVVIVNTCAFIESAKQESIDNILDVAWLKKNRSLKGIIVTGCLSERYRDEIMEELPEVDAVIGVGSRDRICEAVEEVLAGRKFSAYEDKESVVIGGERILTTPEYSACLRVSEGCDNRCSYCAIPDIRGRHRSRPIEEIVEEARGLEELGVRELCLIAQDTTRYGLDLYGEYKLDELVRRICAETSIPWIRLLYCYPDKITDGLIEEFKTNPRLVKYIDIPIQHISDSVLARMNRHGDSACIRDTISRLRAAVPDITLRTTAIVGFPGETEEDFEILCEFIRDMRFDRLGAFTYSAEEGTPAAEFDGQIDEQTKTDRYDTLMSIQLEINAEKNREKIGSKIEVLCEGYDVVAESYYGRSSADAAEIDGKVYFSSERKLAAGEFVSVEIEDSLDYDLIGSAVNI